MRPWVTYKLPPDPKGYIVTTNAPVAPEDPTEDIRYPPAYALSIYSDTSPVRTVMTMMVTVRRRRGGRRDYKVEIFDYTKANIKRPTIKHFRLKQHVEQEIAKHFILLRMGI